jgi:soluble lytic murein transglycosylase
VNIVTGPVRAFLLVAVAACPLTCLSDTEIAQQRALFIASYVQAELGDWTFVENLSRADRDLLESYLLWPDLEAAYLRATVRSTQPAVIENFLARHAGTRPARELRYHYALELARRDDLAAYLQIYVDHYAALGDPVLDCIALRARIAAGEGKDIVAPARKLWLVGRSQVAECDPVFDYLKEMKLLDAVDYRARYALAIEDRSFGLARWLGRSIDSSHEANAQGWLDAESNPEKYLASHSAARSDKAERARLAFAAEQLAYLDPDRAHELWGKATARHPFNDVAREQVNRHIALWTARDGLPAADDRLSALPESVTDDEVLRWRARTSLRGGDWDGALRAIAAMPNAEQRRDEWRYWRAISLRETGDDIQGDTELSLLATERGYYGFLAADELDRPYSFRASILPIDSRLQTDLEQRSALLRARELFFVGLDGRGRSEWDAAVDALAPAEKAQAAILAHRWGWHSRAIATAASVHEYNDLDLRYPLPFRDDFDHWSLAARIPLTWAYSIARSESLFMRDARSGAGAVGIMQLLPSTASLVARRLKVPYLGLETLTDPASSIRLGSAYLSEMTTRFEGNRVLATAAYNAGPERVYEWLPRRDPIDTRIWIEGIPYNETRAYVRRVLEAEAIFHWRLTGGIARLSDQFVAIRPAESDQRIARSSR